MDRRLTDALDELQVENEELEARLESFQEEIRRIQVEMVMRAHFPELAPTRVSLEAVLWSREPEFNAAWWWENRRRA